MSNPSPERKPIPEPSDGDFLERVERSVRVARDFKGLVVDLCTQDWTDEVDPDSLAEDDVRFDEEGRFFEPVHLFHGDYSIERSDGLEVVRANNVESLIELTNREGGRKYGLVIGLDIGIGTTVQYFEDEPITFGVGIGQHDVMGRFMTTHEMASSLGVTYKELDMIESLTVGIRAVQDAGRLTPVRCPGL